MPSGWEQEGEMEERCESEAWFSNSGKNSAAHNQEVISVGGEKKTRISKSEREADRGKWEKKQKWKNDLMSSGKKTCNWIEGLIDGMGFRKKMESYFLPMDAAV